MKVLYLGIVRPDLDLVGCGRELVKATDVSEYSRFTGSKVAEFLTEFGMIAADRTPVGEYKSVTEKSYVFHVHTVCEQISGVMITSTDYPPKKAHSRLEMVLKEFCALYPPNVIDSTKQFRFEKLKEYITKFQSIEDDDVLSNIQVELDETKIALVDALDKLFNRGEKLDTLVAKSTGLSAQSKLFYNQAKKQNACCTVM